MFRKVQRKRIAICKATRGYLERGGILDRAAAGEPGVRKAPPSQGKDEPAKREKPKPSREKEVPEGIRRSLDPDQSRALASPWAPPKLREEDELERAIRLSLESADNASSSSAHVKKHRENSIDLGDEGDFPALNSSPQSSPPAGVRGAVWGTGKGKKRVW